MKNLTVSVDEETYTRARVVAAKRGTSVSRLVREYLSRIAESESETGGSPSFHVFKVDDFELPDRQERHQRHG